MTYSKESNETKCSISCHRDLFFTFTGWFYHIFFEENCELQYLMVVVTNIEQYLRNQIL